jgi:hypothetical protein
MFFLIRSFLRWKIHILLDNNQTPDAWMRWFLKKDKVLSQYYQDLLQLEEILDYASLIDFDEQKNSENILFFESCLNSKANKTLGQYVDKKPHRDIFRSHRRKIFIIVTSCGLLVVVNLIISFQFSNKRKEIAVIPKTVQKKPEVIRSNENLFSHGPAMVLIQDVIPSELQEVFRPAFVPLQETYESGKQTLLDELDSLPLQPMKDLRKILYTKHETSLNLILQSDTHSSSSTSSDRFFIDRLLDADYWFSTDYQNK